MDQGKTTHIINLDGGEAFAMVSHNTLTRQIRKSADETKRLDKRVGSVLNGRVIENRRATSTHPHSYTN